MTDDTETGTRRTWGPWALVAGVGAVGAVALARELRDRRNRRRGDGPRSDAERDVGDAP